ncbi:MAG: hypothetical protein WAN65_03495 [Candidatus Sulfotelmatobacter sp.]
MEIDTAVITTTALIPTAISSEIEAETEQQIAATITELWTIHTQVKISVKRTKKELAAVRSNLAERLHSMKQLLARPGRAGQWSGFLAERGISRTSADRLVSSHEKLIGVDGNGTAGAIKELTPEKMKQLAKSTWSKVRKNLETHRAMYEFFSQLIIESGVAHEDFDDGILVLLDPPPALEAAAGAEVVPDVVGE